MPYDQFVAKLLNPAQPGDPEGFLIGVNWRGETSAAVTPWMQASQNTAQAFLGVNFKCNACHDSFVSKWKLKDAYGLAAYFSPEPKLQLFRCDIAQDEYARAVVPLSRAARGPPPSSSLDDRRATAAAIFTDPRNGRMPRTVVNRIWTQAPRPRHRPQLGRDGRQAVESRRCSTGWPATSSRTSTTSST